MSRRLTVKEIVTSKGEGKIINRTKETSLIKREEGLTSRQEQEAVPWHCWDYRRLGRGSPHWHLVRPLRPLQGKHLDFEDRKKHS